MVRIGFSVIAVLLVAAAALLTWKGNHLWVWAIVGPLVLLGLRDMLQTKHAILRNYPIIGHGRYLLESIRPEIM